MFKFLKEEFWVTNISDKNVSLRDLALTIPAYQSFNLLGRKFPYTYEQLELSATEGSLYKKRDRIKMGITHRQIPDDKKLILSTQPVPRRKRTAVVIEEPEYSDWLFSDEEFADEMSEPTDD